LFESVLRLHLGEPLPASPPPRAGGHAIIDYVVAEQAGVLAAAPPAGPQPGTEPGVTMSIRPLRAVGDRIELTHTNRDYLSVISVIGPDPTATDRAVTAQRAVDGWKIEP